MSEGNFYCKWCDTVKPISERRIVYVNGFPEFIGCVSCETKRRD